MSEKEMDKVYKEFWTIKLVVFWSILAKLRASLQL